MSPTRAVAASAGLVVSRPASAAALTLIISLLVTLTGCAALNHGQSGTAFEPVGNGAFEAVTVNTGTDNRLRFVRANGRVGDVIYRGQNLPIRGPVATLLIQLTSYAMHSSSCIRAPNHLTQASARQCIQRGGLPENCEESAPALRQIFILVSASETYQFASAGLRDLISFCRRSFNSATQNIAASHYYSFLHFIGRGPIRYDDQRQNEHEYLQYLDYICRRISYTDDPPPSFAEIMMCHQSATGNANRPDGPMIEEMRRLIGGD